MAQSLYVYGPAGCGKTTNAEKLRKHFGLTGVVDEYGGPREDNRTIQHQDFLVMGTTARQAPPGMRSMSYDEAAKAANIPLKGK
jgi:GTPase SAR1 family protein